ncbi:hypothetical protein [Streptacidiphilus neutrinimicus]|uniref:hypothetical protein n=1 Tax=Streptacidiphilus neutrinimicus TaxID=105420 RepID=UPI0005A77E2E|nr:hypothetical protein [Streptacidiphilus neutrinimicus]
MGDAVFVRFQAASPNARGHFPGVFALLNGLARAGRLSEEEHRFWRAANDWYDACLTDPSTVDPTVYDRELHPAAASWFKSAAGEFVEGVSGCLRILAAHDVPCERLESSAPGRVIYEDDHQIVVVPWTPTS